MPVEYHRNKAGEDYVTRARFGPVGRDLGRRTVLVNLDARRRAPVGPGRASDPWAAGYPGGRLARSIHSEVIYDEAGNLIGRITADVRRPGELTSYAASVHEGSTAHAILPRRQRWLRWPTEGGDVFSRGVLHPGNRRPRAFLRDALEAARG